jgi:hypothetical protein
MNLEDWLKDLVFPLTVGIVAPSLAAWFGKFEWTLWSGLAVILAGVVIFLAEQLRRAKRSQGVLSAAPQSAAGIREVPGTTGTDLVKLVASCSSSFYFLGVSSNRTANNNVFLQSLVELARRGGDVRFLLFDPHSPHFGRRAADEGVKPDIWAKDIAATVARIESAASTHETTIHVRYYADYPIWRMIAMDRRAVRLNYFLDKRRLTESPTLELESGNDAILQPFLKYFDELWDTARPIDQ